MNLLKKQLLSALIGLSRASESKEIFESSGQAFMEGLALAYGPELELNDERVEQMIQKLHVEKALMAPDCAACQYPCGRTADYDMDETLEASPALRDAKLQLLDCLGTLANNELSASDGEQRGPKKDLLQFFADALFQISCTYEVHQLTDLIRKADPDVWK